MKPMFDKVSFIKARWNYQAWYQGENRAFEEITPFRSLEDEHGTISGLLSFVRTSVEAASLRYPSSIDLYGMIPSKSKPSKLDFLLDTRIG